jgi:hypothetical protein
MNTNRPKLIIYNRDGSTTEVDPLPAWAPSPSELCIGCANYPGYLSQEPCRSCGKDGRNYRPKEGSRS